LHLRIIAPIARVIFDSQHLILFSNFFVRVNHNPVLSVHQKPTVEFKIFKNSRNFEIKNLKRTSHHFKNFGQNRIKNSSYFILKNLSKVRPLLKSKKIHFVRFPLTQDYRGLILFNPCLFPTRSPPPIAGGEAFLDLWPRSAGGDF
jgi:hypothetical protein